MPIPITLSFEHPTAGTIAGTVNMADADFPELAALLRDRFETPEEKAGDVDPPAESEILTRALRGWAESYAKIIARDRLDAAKAALTVDEPVIT